jgi:signal transduction histidine kinase
VLAADAQRRDLQEQLQAGAGQRLASVGRYLDLALSQARAEDDHSAAERLAAARADLDAALADVRELAAGIHPAALTDGGLGPALTAIAARAPVPVGLAFPGGRLPAVVETAIYFVCAEALANIAKHARATRADVEIRSDGRVVTVLVEDDGVGGADPSAGSGLHGAADRIEALGGRLNVRSAAGQGTRISAEIPVAVT